MAPNDQAPSAALNHQPSVRSYAAVASSGAGSSSTLPQAPNPLSTEDLKSVAADIKETLGAVILNLREEMPALCHRVSEVEKSTSKHEKVL